ncbi:MAG: group I intron-associated PD-(D/E)XK endonuclease [Candidatus Omnitrophota bacterium]|nr:group I intron-associated PD-(D/E)XK endonuclease [Candidatus Omnitrophota bacterium]
MHHTKVKADIGVAKVIADLAQKGHVPCMPLSEHQPYDIVAILRNGKAVKLQVKYATLIKSGTVEVKFRTSWADKHGTHMRTYKTQDFDYYAIYCPDKEVVLYVPNTAKSPKVIRFDKTVNNQTKYVKWANDYLDMKRESSETIRHTPEMVKT